MTLNEDEFGLVSGKKGHFKYDILWRRIPGLDTGTGTHMSNSDEGIYNSQEIGDQYIKVDSGERLQIMKKGCKRCIIIQKNGARLHVVLDNVYYVLKLWYNHVSKDRIVIS